MESILTHAHSGLRWVILALILVTLVVSFIGKGKGTLTEGNKKVYLFTMISMHLQLLPDHLCR